jgi:hypothetical protein
VCDQVGDLSRVHSSHPTVSCVSYHPHVISGIDDAWWCLSAAAKATTILSATVFLAVHAVMRN